MRQYTELLSRKVDVDSPASGIKLLCLLPSIPLGGMERAAIRLVEHLMLRGAEAHFIAEQRWGVHVQRNIESIGADWTGVPFVAKLGLPHKPLEWRWAIRSFARSPADLAKVFANYRPRQLLATNLNNAFFARKLACRPETVSVFRVPNPPGTSTAGIKRRIDRAVWKAVYHAFDVLVCNSEYTANRVADLIGDDRRIRIIRNFPPELARANAVKSPRLNPSRTTVAYVGQISRNKGVEVLVDAALEIVCEYDDVDFALAGPDVWQDTFASEIRQKVAEAGFEERIVFLGHIDDVHGFLSQAAIHVCPSIGKAESFPNAVLDAKQAGLPSIVFPTAGLPEAVENEVSGLITSGCSTTDLLTSLRKLLDDTPLRRCLAEGAMRSLARHDPDSISSGWISILNGGD